MNRIKLTYEQIEVIVSYMEKHPKLVCGRINEDFSVVEKYRLWDDLTKELNNAIGCTKDTKKWKRSWTDLKLATKDKLKKIRLQNNGKESRYGFRLTKIEARIAQLMGLKPVKEHPQIKNTNASTQIPTSPPAERVSSEHTDVSTAPAYQYDRVTTPIEIVYTSEVSPGSQNYKTHRSSRSRARLRRLVRNKADSGSTTESYPSIGDRSVNKLVELQEKSNDILQEMADSLRSMAESFKVIAESLNVTFQSPE